METAQILGKISFKISWFLWQHFKPYRTLRQLNTDIDTWAVAYALNQPINQPIWKRKEP